MGFAFAAPLFTRDSFQYRMTSSSHDAHRGHYSAHSQLFIIALPSPSSVSLMLASSFSLLSLMAWF
jgi:hypothetical protein